MAALKRNLAATVPTRRPGASADVAHALVFLATDEAAFVTGIELWVDGGAVQV